MRSEIQCHSITDDGEATFVDPGYEQSDKYGEPRYEVISLPNFPAEQTTLDITLENFQYFLREIGVLL